MGNYFLKTASDYVVPVEQRLTVLRGLDRITKLRLAVIFPLEKSITNGCRKWLFVRRPKRIFRMSRTETDTKFRSRYMERVRNSGSSRDLSR